MPENQTQEDLHSGVAADERLKLQRPPLYKVLLHNDDYTSMEFVVQVLKTIFGKSEEEATDIMLTVHQKGKGIAGIYTREIAEMKVKTVHTRAKKYGFPLKCSLEREQT